MAGYIENSMSKINEVNLLTSELTSTTSEAAGADSTRSGNCSIDYGGGYVTTANLKIEPQVEWHYIESLQKKFEAVIRGYCDLNLLNNARQEEADPQDVRKLIKHVADIIWNTLSKAQYKDRPHLQSIYRYLCTYITHYIYRYIDPSRHNFDNCLLFHDFPPSELLGRAIGFSAGSSSFEGKIIEGDNFQNYGGKDQCIYMLNVVYHYPTDLNLQLILIYYLQTYSFVYFLILFTVTSPETN